MNKTRQWATLTAVGCLAILAIGFFLVVKPQRSHAAALRTQTQSVQQSNSTLLTQVSQLKQQQKDLPAQQKLLSQIATKIPDNPALPALIRQLSAAADGAGVSLVSLAPSAPTIVAGKAATASTGTATTASGSAAAAPVAPLASIPLTLQVQGGYFNVVQFFSAVESLSRAMLVTGFQLTPNKGGAAAAGGAASGPATAPGTLQAQITAQVFESPQLAAVAPPATSTSPTTTTGH
jgi:type IV pilus assembly protein PilO